MVIQVKQQIKEWAESYIVLPFSLVLLAILIAIVRHYQDAEFDLGVLIDLGVKIFKSVAVINLTSHTIQATNGWSKDPTLAGDYHDLWQAILIFYAWLYVFFCLA